MYLLIPPRHVFLTASAPTSEFADLLAPLAAQRRAATLLPESTTPNAPPTPIYNLNIYIYILIYRYIDIDRYRYRYVCVYMYIYIYISLTRVVYIYAGLTLSYSPPTTSTATTSEFPALLAPLAAQRRAATLLSEATAPYKYVYIYIYTYTALSLSLLQRLLLQPQSSLHY